MITVGIDIAKLHFDLHLLPEGTVARYDNNAQGIQDCRLFLAQATARANPPGGHRRIRDGPGRGTPGRRHARHRGQSHDACGTTPDPPANWPRPTGSTPESSPSSPPPPAGRRARAARRLNPPTQGSRGPQGPTRRHARGREQSSRTRRRFVPPRERPRRSGRLIEKQIAQVDRATRRADRRRRDAPTQSPDPRFGSRHRGRHRRHARDATARTRTSQSPSDRRLGRPGPAEPRQRPVPRKTHDRRRTRASPHRPVHAHARRPSAAIPRSARSTNASWTKANPRWPP